MNNTSVTKNKPVDISVIMPVFNAGVYLRSSVEELIGALNTTRQKYEILLRDDASQDESTRVIRALEERYEAVRGFGNERNQGLGSTLRHLFKDADGKMIVYADADLLFGGMMVVDIVQQLTEHDVVVASRYLNIKNAVPLARAIASRFYYYFCRALMGVAVRDIGSGCVGFNRYVIDALNLRTNGFGIHAEIFKQLRQLGIKAKEIPAKIKHYRKGSFSLVKHGGGILVETLGVLFSKRKV